MDFTKEGDNYFDRNIAHMSSFQGDIFSRTLESHDLKGKKVLEIGCSNGFRLARLNAECYGTDISEKAINEGKKSFPQLHLSVSPSDRIYFNDNTFDVVIVSFVLHWVLRDKIFKTLSEIDRVLKPGGKLLIQDFFPIAPMVKPYHHQEGLFTYKTFYAKIFKLLGYSEEYRMPFEHGAANVERPELTGGDNDALFSVLMKNSLIE